MKHRLDGFQKPIDDGKRREVGLALIHTGQTDSGAIYSECSCGAPFTHPRTKARENAIQRHIDKKHNGRGVWL